MAIYYFYFTTQTNYLVLIYLFAFLFESKFKENSKPSFYILLSITIYITITMLVFWIGIISNNQERSKYGTDIYLWFKKIILNLIMPIVMILNFALSCGRDFYSLKNHHKLYMWFILFSPCFYVVMVMVRGVLRVKQGENINTCYPYFFFNYQKYGVGILVTTIIFLLIISIGLQYLYLWIDNIQYKKSMMMINQIFQSLLILMVLNYKK
ncbi:Pr6Pr family membrane protein [Spiroplasma ixodetis]|uniref:Transmembrane protein n=1 Tax=Spiroplasma ixodetis TaxID=2141 RepID=A0ABM8JSL1_9MOLU